MTIYLSVNEGLSEFLPYLYLGRKDGKLICVLFSFHFLFSLYFKKFYLSVVDLQCCVSFKCTAQ